MPHQKYEFDEGNVQKVIVLKEDEDGKFSPRDIVGADVGTVQHVIVDNIADTPVGTGGVGGVSGPVSIQDGTDPTRKLAVDASGRIGIGNFPATQPVSGSVSVSNFPGTQPVSGTVTVSNPTANPETGLAKNATLTDGTQKTQVTNFPATQAVSGTVTVSNPTANPETGLAKDATLTARLPASLDADGGLKVHVQNPSGGSSGGLTNTELRASAVPVSGTVSVGNFPATQPVSGTVSVANFPATQPVSGTVTANTGLAQPLTDTQLRAAAVPVSGTFWQATQPVSIAGTVNVSNGQTQPLTDAQLRAAAVPVSLVSVPAHPVTQSGSWSFAPAPSTTATYTTETPLITPAAVGTAKEYLALMNPVGSTKVIHLRAMWVMLSGVTLTAQELWARRITAVVGGTAVVAAKNDSADVNSVVTTLVHSPTSVTAALTTGLWQAHWVVGISGVATTAPAHAGDLPGSVVRFGMDGQKPPTFRPGEGLGIQVISRLGANTAIIGLEWTET